MAKRAGGKGKIGVVEAKPAKRTAKAVSAPHSERAGPRSSAANSAA
jgi:hypothetical protein